jgi:hypothetical protein
MIGDGRPPSLGFGGSGGSSGSITLHSSSLTNGVPMTPPGHVTQQGESHGFETRSKHIEIDLMTFRATIPGSCYSGVVAGRDLDISGPRRDHEVEHLRHTISPDTFRMDWDRF